MSQKKYSVTVLTDARKSYIKARKLYADYPIIFRACGL